MSSLEPCKGSGNPSRFWPRTIYSADVDTFGVGTF